MLYVVKGQKKRDETTPHLPLLFALDTVLLSIFKVTNCIHTDDRALMAMGFFWKVTHFSALLP